MTARHIPPIAVLLLAVTAGCGSPGDPLADLAHELDRYPEYFVTLEDMDVSGAFFKSYYHRYKATVATAGPGDQELTFSVQRDEWYEVEESTFRKFEPMLGMVVLSKGGEGKVDQAAYPPGYQYVGNPRYGSWQTDAHGNSFWEFYGKYALFSHLLGMGTRPLYQSDWGDYRSYRSSGRPYFGPSQQYGTSGSYTKQSHPTFFERQQARAASRGRSFSQKASQRTGGRSRSGSRGK